MMKFASKQESTIVYGNDNLGMTISGAFLVLTPQKEVSKFKHVEKRRGTLNYDSFRKFLTQDTFSKFANSSIQPGQFQAGLQEEEYSYISSIAVEEECNCQNLSFNIKMASTPKPTKKRASVCKESHVDQLLAKKRKIQKKKLNISTSTNIVGCEANFLSFIKQKKLTNSIKKDLKIKLKKSIEKKSELKSSRRKLSVNPEFINQYGNFLIEQQMNDFNLINENNCENNFNQFGQLKVWYV